MQALLNHRIRLILNDGRAVTGQLLAFDRFMNLVVADAEEYRTVKNKSKNGEEEIRRSLGLMILRGEHVVSFTVEGPPPVSMEDRKQPIPGPGLGKAVGRGMPVLPAGVAAPGLAGPMPGIGAGMMGAPPMMPPPMVPGMGPPPPAAFGRGVPPP